LTLTSLVKRATGFEYDETTIVGGKVVKVVRKQALLDVTACIFGLKNPNPKRWRDAQHQGLSTEPPEEITIEDIKADIWKLEEACTGMVFE